MDILTKYPPFKVRSLVKDLIDKYGISQSEISRQSGVAQCSISRLYNGIATANTTTIGTYYRIAYFAATVVKDEDEK